MTTLQLKCLGELNITQDGLPIPDLKSGKGRALISYLAFNGKRFTRSSLAGMFWMDMPESRAMTNLRKVLNRLKSISSHLRVDRETLAFNLDAPYWMDVKEFLAAAEDRTDIQRLQHAVSLYDGDFLDGFEEDATPLFTDWMRAQRATLHEIALNCLQTLISHTIAQGHYSEAIQFTRHLLRIEPWNEEAHREQMRLLALTGQRSAAIKQYETCRRLLWDELGVELALETVSLYQQIVSEAIGKDETNSTKALPAGFREPKTNLPVQLTSFIGREMEIERLLALFKETRWLTLTGAGGTGKTRLALQAAAELAETFEDGVWLVELAPVADPLLVPQTVITGLGQAEQAGKAPMNQLADFLSERRLLLILDNCEHLAWACRELASSLLSTSSDLKILATSRGKLGAAGELTFRVPPLGTPDPQRLPPLDELSCFDAVRLFTERARAVSPGFTLNKDNTLSLALITRRLDGIPLAIELAAARLRTLSAAQVAERLQQTFSLLVSGSRAALPRHQTLASMIGWSYDLLTEGEQALLRGLSVFAGGWTLNAAEEVCGEPGSALELLEQLLEKSLILAAPAPGGETRYRMLEMIRQYAHARLVEAGEAEGTRDRHLAYFLCLVERLEPSLRGKEQIRTLDYLESELDNLRLGLEWALQDDVESGLRLAAALQWFWHIRFHWSEGIAWLEKLLQAEALSRDSEPPVGPRASMRAKALTALGLHLEMRDPPPQDSSKAVLEEAIKLYRTTGLKNRQGLGLKDRFDLKDRIGLAWALVWLSDCKTNEGNPAQSRALGEEALALFRECEDPNGIADSLRVLGYAETDPTQKIKIYQEMLEIDESIEDVDGIATAYYHVGFSQCINGDYGEACTAFKKSREYYQLVGNTDMVSLNELWLSFASFLNGEIERADQYLGEVLHKYPLIAHDLMKAFILWWKSMIVFAQGDYEQVGELNDEAGQIAQKTGNTVIRAYVLYNQARLARLQGDAVAARCYAEEGMQAGQAYGNQKMLFLLELGHQALLEGNLTRAGALFREGFQSQTFYDFMPYVYWVLDGLAVLAMRERQLERAARLFGTRYIRGIAHTLSPIEQAWRETDLAELRTALGDECYAALQAEGFGLTLTEIMALAQGIPAD